MSVNERTVSIADEVNGYTATVLTGSRCVSRFYDLINRTKAAGGATVGQSYAATYLLGLIEMAELCAAVAKGKHMGDMLKEIERRVEELESDEYASTVEPVGGVDLRAAAREINDKDNEEEDEEDG